MSSHDTPSVLTEIQDEKSSHKLLPTPKKGFFKKSFDSEETYYSHLINEMSKECLTHNSDIYKIHLSRIKGLKLINKIMKKFDKSLVTFQDLMKLVWSTLSCIHHFQITLCQNNSIFDFQKRRRAKKAIDTFDKLVQRFQNFDYEIMRSMLMFIKEARLWNVQFMSHDLISRYLALSNDKTSIIYQLLVICEEYLIFNNIIEGRELLGVIDTMFEEYHWRSINSVLLEKLLGMYFERIKQRPTDEADLSIEKGLEICLRHLFKNLDIKDQSKALRILLEWIVDAKRKTTLFRHTSTMLEYLARNYNTKLYRESLPSDVIDSVLQMISSVELEKSLLGCRVMQNLMDRCDNRLKFDTPRIFYEHSNHNFIVNICHDQDKEFFQKHREAFHAAILTCFMTHGVMIINLENIYTLVAIITVEIPCAYTAAAVVCMAMSIQEATFEDKDLELSETHRLHATVLCILSLVCYVFKAEVFYSYINGIIDKRAAFAPHLNPPLVEDYNYSQHHIHWNKPELFFEDWQTRYGLWKCFKVRQSHKDSAN